LRMYKKNLTPMRLFQPASCFILILILLTSFGTSHAEEKASINIESAELILQDKTYFLNAQIHYHLSDEAIDALHNGISLTFNVDLSITESRKWLWEKYHHQLSFPYQLKYHTLAKTYLVSNSTNDIPVHALKTNHNLDISASLNAYLDIEALPLPMRPLAYITSGWYLHSNTFQCPLAH
ncbi:MAG: DUF4390 domain-containing protein, partial [Cycloclasticus sp.]